MARKHRTEPEIETENNDDELESMEDESRDNWIRLPYTRRSYNEARKTLQQARDALYGKAGTSSDPEVRAAFAVFIGKRDLVSFLKEGQQS